MIEVILTLGVFLLIVTAMSLGVLLGRKPISGSCGGLQAMDGAACDLCGNDPNKCKNQ